MEQNTRVTLFIIQNTKLHSTDLCPPEELEYSIGLYDLLTICISI